MVPPSNSAKALQQNRPRPVVSRPVVPAIPLPFLQKRKLQTDAPEQAKEEVITQLAVEVPTHTTPLPAELGHDHINGDSDKIELKTSKEVAKPISSVVPAASPTESESPEELPAQTEASKDVTPASETPLSATSEELSSTSKSTYQMPPAFYPANQPNTMAPEPAKFYPQALFNGQAIIHNSYPSAGSLVFGGNYTESSHSSPAPPLSAGHPPPFPFQQQAPHPPGHHGHHQSNGSFQQNMGNGFSHMVPPGFYSRQENFVNHQGHPNENHSRRQMVSFGPPDGFSPSATPMGFDYQKAASFDQSNPHSIHGSQSPIPNEQDINGAAFYNQQPHPMANGANGHMDEVRMHHQGPPKHRPGSQPFAPGHNYGQLSINHPPPYQPVDNLDGLVAYLQSQFSDPALADYTLELRYSDDRAPPVRIPGHNLLFARSLTLKTLMADQTRESNIDGPTVKNLLIESDDRFLRSDAFWMALQRLYGGPLLDAGVLTGLNSPPYAQPGSPIPGTPSDRFELALGYAAAGHILKIPPVVNRGIDIASHLVSWYTLEKALEFSLDGGLDPKWTIAPGGSPEGEYYCPCTYGPVVNVLIHNALNFIITHFPPNFELDVTVGEPLNNCRLPKIKEDRPSAANPRLSFIKFGDHPSEDSSRSTTGTSVISILSRVLLNLPFQLLKYVLESSRLGDVSDWATTMLRQKAMHATIAERERRRIKVRGNSQVSRAERSADSKRWEVVGWQEAVIPHGGNEATPSLIRTWVDFTLPERDD